MHATSSSMGSEAAAAWTAPSTRDGEGWVVLAGIVLVVYALVAHGARHAAAGARHRA
jgi:hypothetical protein